MSRLLALLLLGLLALGFAGRAQATVTCSVTSISNISFGTVDPTSALVDASAQLNYSCTYNGGLLGGLSAATLRMCFSFGSGSGSSSGALDNRQLLNGANTDRLSFQLYKDPTRLIIWGGINGGAYTPQTVSSSFTILSNGQSQNGSLVVYARVPAGQTGVSPGSYASQFIGDLASNVLSYRYTEALLGLGTPPTSCQAGGTGGANVALPTFSVGANVLASCSFGSATELNFGNVPGLLDANQDQSSLLRMTCTYHAPWQIGLDDGQNASDGQRRMKNGNSYVNYELYRDAARNLRWGATLNSDTSQGSGSGSEQMLTVFGRVPPQAAQPVGSYGDVIKVTITY